MQSVFLLISTQNLAREPAFIRTVIIMLTSDTSIIDFGINKIDKVSQINDTVRRKKKINNLCLVFKILCILIDHKSQESAANKVPAGFLTRL